VSTSEMPATEDAATTASDDPTAHAAKPTTLLLVRHAVTAHTGSILTGRAPGVPLSDQGRSEALAVATRLGELPIRALYSSPIERTMQTAQIIGEACELAPVQLDDVLEADFGDWTGSALSALAKEPLWSVVQRTPSRVTFPNGESIGEMQARVVRGLERVAAKHPGEFVCVVSHADPIKAAIAAYTGMHLDHFQRIVVSPASVTLFTLSGHGAVMIKCNDTGGLSDLAPMASDSDDDAPTTGDTTA
jgi:probable phosphomutase (TIGR03848 family)